MKISRRNLRKLILENIAEEQKSVINEVNLRKYQKILSKAKQADAQKGSEEYESAKTASEELSALKTDKKRPFKKVGPRQERAELILQGLLDFLAGKEPPPAALEPAPVDDTPVDDAPVETKKSWTKYTEDGDWEYQIQGDTPNQIWVTRKAGQEKEYRLDRPKFRSTVLKLDGTKDPEVAKKAGLPPRTPESIKNCPALKVAPKPKPKPKPKTKTPEKAESEVKKDPQKGSFIRQGSAVYRFDTNEGHTKYFKAKGYKNFSLEQPREPALVQVSAESDTIMFIGFSGTQLIMTDKDATFTSPGNIAQNDASIKRMTTIYNDVIQKGDRDVRDPTEKQTQAESLSRGSLMRQRYRKIY